MKRAFFTLLIVGLLGALITNDRLVNFFYENNTDQISRNKYFTRLSFKYYGTPKYGKELALINQHVKSYQGSEENDIIIPSQDALVHLYETFNMALAQNILHDFLTNTNKEVVTQNPVQVKIFQSSILPPLMGVIVILAVVSGYLLGRKRRKKEIKLARLNFSSKKKSKNKTEDEKDLVTVQNKDEILINFKDL